MSEDVKKVTNLEDAEVDGINPSGSPTDLDPNKINEDNIIHELDTSKIPDPDLLIRTGGEFRLSNFLLWQIAYSEIYVTKKYWPEFRENELSKAIKEYQTRDRRFGKIFD